MAPRQLHKAEVLALLARRFGLSDWRLSLPPGSGQETYFAHSSDKALFVKLGARPERANAMADMGLAPPVLACDALEDGTTILVQSLVEGRTPSRRDFQSRLEQFAQIVGTMHHSAPLRAALPPAPSEQYKHAGLAALDALRVRWQGVRAVISSREAVSIVERGLDRVEAQVDSFRGEGLASSHNDICNANWLLTPQGELFLVDLEMMSREDPACDLGAILWWYYPPQMRSRFLQIAGYSDSPALRARMQARMAMHSLSITLPREGSFDTFDAAGYYRALTDFKAILEGRENPQGYA